MASTNKAITLELARQIASVGGDPQEALKSGTFAPGELDDPTAAGSSCNDADDALGCIFSKDLLVEDATAEEIDAAVAEEGVSADDASNSTAIDHARAFSNDIAGNDTAFANANFSNDTASDSASSTIDCNSAALTRK